MELRRWLRPAAAGVLLLAGTGAIPGPEPVAALRMLEKGEWLLRDESAAVRRICLGNNPSVMIQILHPREQCSQFVIENAARQATIHYTCPGHGHGRTTVRVETPRLLQIETQGVVDGTPFAATFEARRGGACG